MIGKSAWLYCLLLPGLINNTVADNSDDRQGFGRCASCHLDDGAGVPGAFPPLKNRMAMIAQTPEGRAYLVAVVNVGLMGNISVNGVSYFGAMPAQGAAYDARGIAEVLNYSVQTLDKNNVKPDWLPFSAAEVEKYLATDAPGTALDTAQLRRALIRRYPELQ